MTVEKKKYLIQLLLDHASPDAFFGWVDKGIAPNISKYILGEKTEQNTYSNATISRNIVTGYPTTSSNSHVSIVTGSYARKNNLTYTNYWDLTGKIPEYVDIERPSLKAFKEMNTIRINPLCKTIFEHTKDSASFHMINRGAKIKMFTLKTILFKFAPLFLKVKRQMKGGDEGPLENPEFWRMFLRNNIGHFLKRANKKGAFPMMTFIVHLLSDEFAHKHGFNSEKYKQAIIVLDYLIKCIIEGVDLPKKKAEESIHIPGLKEMGLFESMIWNICTDHAGREIIRDQYVFINSLVRIELGLNLLDGDDQEHKEYIDSLKGNLSKLNGFSVIGGEVWHNWFSDETGNTPNDFIEFHNETFFRNLVPHLKISKNNPNPEKIDLIEYLLKQPWVGLIIIPEENAQSDDYFNISNPKERLIAQIPRNYTIRIISKEGTGHLERSLVDGVIHYSYILIEKDDPIDYTEGNIKLEYGKPYSHQVWLEHTIEHNFPDFPHRLFGFFDGIHTPNFVVTSSFDWHYLSAHKMAQKRENLLKDYQTHGGPFKVESIVPLTIAGPGIKKGAEIKVGRNIDILPTLLTALDVDYDKDKLDGEILKEVLE